jgi:aromatic-L-amino-acid/L-tryptophan decarboxylase
MRLAALFAAWVDKSPDFERTAPTVFSVVCFRAHPQNMDDEETLNKLNEDLMNAVNETGQIFISHTKLNGRYTLRLAIGNIRTQESHITQAWALLQETLNSLIVG